MNYTYLRVHEKNSFINFDFFLSQFIFADKPAPHIKEDFGFLYECKEGRNKTCLLGEFEKGLLSARLFLFCAQSRFVFKLLSFSSFSNYMMVIFLAAQHNTE